MYSKYEFFCEYFWIKSDANLEFGILCRNPTGEFYNYTTKKQLGEFNTWRKRNIQDGLIDFRMTSELICNLVRGLSKPYIGAHCVLNGVEIKVWEVELSYSNDINSEPGKVLELLDKNIKVKTANGAIILKNHNFTMLPNKGSYIK